MLFNTTYINKEYTKARTEQLGKPFSILQKIRIGGVGSGKLMIAELSNQLQTTKRKFADLNYGNIELMSKGVIVHFTNRQERFSWVIPYYKLVVYNASFFSIHADGQYVRFYKNNRYKENKKFISKMIDFKNSFLQLDYYDG